MLEFLNDASQNLTVNVACAKMQIRKAFEEVKIDMKITKLTRHPECLALMKNQ